MNKSCLQIEPLLAGYALGALALEEEVAVEAHLETCEACQVVLEDFTAVSDGLLGAAPPIQPPKRMRARLLAEMEPQLKPVGEVSRRLNFNPRLTAAIGFLTIIVSVGLNIYMFRNTNQMLGDVQDLVQQNQTYQSGFVLLADPSSQVVVLEEQSLTGTLVYDPEGQLAILNVQGLAALPEGQVYQVWLIKPDETRISGGLFNTWDETGSASYVINSPSSMETFVGIGVTIEPEGGSAGPTGSRVLGIEL